MQWYRFGDPTAVNRLPIEVRFRTYVQVDEESGCWEWQGHRLDNGYGQFSVRHRGRLAHRVSHELFKGPIPSGLTIDHLCRNKGCVNPDHLEAVTQLVNYRRSMPFRGKP